MMPVIFQINARIWTKELALSSIIETPTETWRALRTKGVEYVWLMGVWETSQSSIEKYCFHPDLVREYSSSRPDWKPTEVGGSPYAIEGYQISRLVGQKGDLVKVKKTLNREGLKLILDFIPNHFNAHSKLLKERSELFFFQKHKEGNSPMDGFFSNEAGYYAHGKDPYFPPWTDTAQLNYFNPATHDFMLDNLLQLSEICDGVRCDMAMLILPDIFQSTWDHLREDESAVPNFWQKSITVVKKKNPAFQFIAETYWDTEWRLQQDGFDYTYDKKLLDLMLHAQPSDIRGHLSGDREYQHKMVHFIENHDEQRSLSAFGFSKAMAAATVIATLPGMTLYFDGQWKGARKRLPVQLASPAIEQSCPCSITRTERDKPCPCISRFYDALLKATNRAIFKEGQWQLINQEDLEDLLIWSWTLDGHQVYVFINLGPHHRSKICRLPHKITDRRPHDILNQIKSPTYFKHMEGNNWQIDLPPFRSAIIEWC